LSDVIVRKRRINWRNLLTVISVTVLVGTEVLAASLAGGWAIAGLLDQGPLVEYAFMIVFTVLGLWGMTKFVRSALAIEPIFGGD
jgi:hypothetical protein